MATPNAYDKGDVVRVSAAFTRVDTGAAVDPTAVLCEIKSPAGAITTYTYGTDAALIKDSTGNYHLDFDVDTTGYWRYRWRSTGTWKAAEWATVLVEASQF